MANTDVEGISDDSDKAVDGNERINDNNGIFNF